MFASSDRNARYKLLCQIETFVEHLSNKVANDQVFPQVIKVRVIKTPVLISSYYSQNSKVPNKIPKYSQVRTKYFLHEQYQFGIGKKVITTEHKLRKEFQNAIIFGSYFTLLN